jgi:hypothetical protein
MTHTQTCNQYQFHNQFLVTITHPNQSPVPWFNCMKWIDMHPHIENIIMICLPYAAWYIPSLFNFNGKLGLHDRCTSYMKPWHIEFHYEMNRSSLILFLQNHKLNTLTCCVYHTYVFARFMNTSYNTSLYETQEGTEHHHRERFMSRTRIHNDKG